MPAQETRRHLAGGFSKKWVMVATTAPKKTAAYSLVLGLLERGQLVLLRQPDLLRELAGIRFRQGERGFMSIEAESAAVHDDVADALALAMGPDKKGSRVICHMARMADPRTAPPEAELPPGWDGGEVVTTGSGLRLFRRPPLQSVDGPELYLPPNTNPEQPVQIGTLRYLPGGLA